MWVMQVIQEEFFHDSKQAVSRQVGLCQIVDLCMALQRFFQNDMPFFAFRTDPKQAQQTAK